MKKKILFLMPSIGCGGVETTLFSLWEAMDRKKYDITLLLIEKKGAFLDKVPEDIKIETIDIPERERGVFYGKRNGLKQIIASGKVWRIPGYLHHVSKWKIDEDRTGNAAYFESIKDSIKPLEGYYDLAIDYFGYATFTTFYLVEKVNAKVKVSWLHSVFSRFSPQSFDKWYRKMDRIFAVSQMVKRDFEDIFPEVQGVELFYNVKDPKIVQDAAKDNRGFNDDYDGKRILTVGRVCHEKGMDMAARAYSRLLQDGYDIRWHIIGHADENEKKEIEAIFSTEKERTNFLFLGVKSNPFPYMKQCDIYVQPSRFEGYCTTTNEARILAKAVVTTDVSGAREQFTDQENGLIVSATVDGIYQGVKQLLDHPEQVKLFEERLERLDCDTRNEVKKLEALLEEKS